MSNDTATGLFNLFRFRSTKNGVTISALNSFGGSYYLRILVNEKRLQFYPASPSEFVIVPVENSTTIKNNNNYTVFNIVDDPQSRFPSEPPAEFFIPTDVDVERAYYNDQAVQAPRIGKYISTSTMNQTEAYTQLYELMTAKSHIRGIEIFQVGAFIYNDLGNDSTLFQILPEQVKLVY